MLISSSVVRSVAAAFGLATAFLITACNRETLDEKSTAIIGTYKLGQEVQVGDLRYTVLGATWMERIEASTPKYRFLVVRLNVHNQGQRTVPLRGFELISSSGERTQETTTGIEDLPEFLGILRSLEPGQAETGTVVFDVPLAAYTLAVPDGQDIEKERVAHIEIPVQVDHPTEQPVQN
jgi:hypothetical protein